MLRRMIVCRLGFHRFVSAGSNVEPDDDKNHRCCLDCGLWECRVSPSFPWKVVPFSARPRLSLVKMKILRDNHDLEMTQKSRTFSIHES